MSSKTSPSIHAWIKPGTFTVSLLTESPRPHTMPDYIEGTPCSHLKQPCSAISTGPSPQRKPFPAWSATSSPTGGRRSCPRCSPAPKDRCCIRSVCVRLVPYHRGAKEAQHLIDRVRDRGRRACAARAGSRLPGRGRRRSDRGSACLPAACGCRTGAGPGPRTRSWTGGGAGICSKSASFILSLAAPSSSSSSSSTIGSKGTGALL